MNKQNKTEIDSWIQRTIDGSQRGGRWEGGWKK